MANESRVFRLPAGMSAQVVANAVEAFLSSAKGMEVQSAETTEGYVVQGRQEKDGWKTIAGMRMASVAKNLPSCPLLHYQLQELVFQRAEQFLPPKDFLLVAQ